MLETLQKSVLKHLGDAITDATIALGELTIEVQNDQLHHVCAVLKKELNFDQLIDVCGVDYLQYGQSEWATEETSTTGFSRGVDRGHADPSVHWEKLRFAVVHHLLSVKNNQRIRVRSFPEGDPPKSTSVIDLWTSADWFEREAFDLYGFVFVGHPDLRRILTDYGFVGHPFRKDFPLIGHVEMRYDAALKRCVYEPVSIQPRTLVPKTIRDDSRYVVPEQPASEDKK